MDDLIRRQTAIDAMLKLQAEDDESYGCHIPEGFDGERAKEALEKLPSVQPDIVEKILAAGNEGKKLRIYIRGRLFEVRELAQ